jgi:hypothetical protein
MAETDTTLETGKPPADAKVRPGKGTGFMVMLLKGGWVLFPMTALLLGAGLGRSFFPEMHTRVFEWERLAEPLLNTQWFTAIHNVPSFNRLPLGGGVGMGIMVAVCGIWVWTVYRRTNEDQIRAVTLRSITSECIWIAIAMGMVVAWKCALGTLSWWAIPPFIATLVSMKVAHDAENRILSNRDTARGREGTR